MYLTTRAILMNQMQKCMYIKKNIPSRGTTAAHCHLFGTICPHAKIVVYFGFGKTLASKVTAHSMSWDVQANIRVQILVHYVKLMIARKFLSS